MPLPPHRPEGHAAPPDEVVGAGTTVDHHESGGSSTGLHIPAKLQAQIGDIPAIPGYEVLGVIAHGGMGYVLRARDLTLRRQVAIKLPLGNLTDDTRERFLREARSAASLRHPNICQIHGVDVTAEGTPFIAMEFLDGRNLYERVCDRRPAPREAASLLVAVARAAAYAHERGIVHRDIKPQNVLVLNESGQPVLTDFGLAKELGRGESEVTHSGQVMGTPSYMSPEQASGRVEAVGPLSDVYSLGAVLYQLLTGEPPFSGPVGEVLKRVQTEPPRPPGRLANVQRDLETVCLKCLEKQPQNRYASAAELADDLERFANGEPIRARRAGVLRRAGWWVRRNRVLAAAIVGVLLAGGVAALALHKANRTNEQAAILQSMPAEEWTDDDLRRLDALTDGLAARDPDRAAKVRARVNEALAESGQKRLQRPALGESDEEYARRVVELLRPRDPALAETLDREYKARLRAWVAVFRVEPLRPDSLAVFAPARGGENPRIDAAPDRVSLGSSFGPGTRPAHLTTVPCRGNAEITVIFTPEWVRHNRLGTILNAPTDRDTGGYAVMLKPAAAGKPGGPEATFADAQTERAAVKIQLLRGEVVVREQEIPAAALPTGPLSVTLQHTGDRVLAQVNGLAPITYRDLFPLTGGVYGVLGPYGVEVLSVEGRKQAASTVVSPLERGDELFLAGDYSAALAFYQQQTVAAAGTEAAPQARFKAAVALLQLKRLDDARDRFRELYVEGQKPWSPLAGCYLVAVQVRRGELGEAAEVLDRVAVEFAAIEGKQERDELLTRLPEDVRDEILLAHRQAAGGVGWLRDDPGRVGKLRRVLRAEEALGVRPEYLGWTRLTYARALRASADPGDRQEAARSLGRWLADDYPPGDLSNPFGVLLAAEYGWVMRELGRAGDALPEIDRRVSSTRGVFRPEGYPLLIERARLHVAVGDPAAAETDLTEFLRNCPQAYRSYRWVADASLMLGLLREQRGDATGALAVWREGLPTRSIADPRMLSETAGAIGLLTVLSLQLLTDTLKDDEFKELVANTLKAQQGGDLLSGFVTKEDILAAANLMRGAIRKPEFRKQLRQFAFQTLPFREYTRFPLLVAVTEATRELALGGSATPEQDAVVVKLAEQGVKAFAENRLGKTQLLQLALTARGSRDFLNWSRLEKTLDPSFRGPLAYALGHRFLRLNKPADAIAFFRTAASDAPPDSPLKKLAEEELAKLQKK
jgi:predicted Ser/Thr protein kinase